MANFEKNLLLQYYTLIKSFFFFFFKNNNNNYKFRYNKIGRKKCPASLKEMVLLFSRSVLSDSLWPHGLQHIRPPCPSPSPGVCPSSCSLHQWCHPGISSSEALFSFCPQSFPASRTMSHLFTPDDQNTWPASVLPVSFQGWSPLSLTGLISLLYKPR